MSLERFTRKEIATIAADRPVIEAAERMRTTHVGAVVVVDEGRPVGMLTDRDLTLRILATGRSGTTPAREVMSRNLVVARADESIDQAVFAMRRHGVRRLPIVDGGGALVGLVALDDLLVLLSGEISSVIQAVIGNRGP